MWTEKYRPESFDDVVGQDEIVGTIRGMLERDHDIPNIRMIGEAGTGKTTVARLIGKELLGDFFDMNFREINSSNERGTESIREVIKSSIHQSLFTPIKIIFMDESDGFTPQAQNMLRKPLEERGSTRFILSANHDKFIKPIRSRCVVFEFKPINEGAVKKRLQHIADSEGMSFNGEVEEIARRCKGDMRTAINELQKRSYTIGCDNGDELLTAIKNMKVEA